MSLDEDVELARASLYEQSSKAVSDKGKSMSDRTGASPVRARSYLRLSCQQSR
jgi:hypothetical protein